MEMLKKFLEVITNKQAYNALPERLEVRKAEAVVDCIEAKIDSVRTEAKLERVIDRINDKKEKKEKRKYKPRKKKDKIDATNEI